MVPLWTYLLLPLFGWLFYKEWTRPNTKRRVARLLANSAIAAAILLLLFPPKQNATASRQALLLTEGADSDSIKALLGQLPDNSPVYSWLQWQYENPQDIDTLHVFGYGLSLADWKSAPLPTLQWHEPGTNGGIAYVDWTTTIRLGDPVHVQGQYRNKGDQPQQITLTWQGQRLDSLNIAANADTVFQLKGSSFHEGATIYQLNGEPVPVIVLPADKLKILVVTAAPSFENNFLVNWLAAAGYPIAVSSQVSKAQYASNFLNRDPIPLQQIGKKQLDAFDLVITDPEALKARGAAFQQALQQQVTQKGLGLLLQTDSTAGAPAWYNRNLRLSLPVSRQGQRFRTIEPAGALRPLWREPEGIRAAVQRHGQGFIVYNSLTSSFSWQLEGRKADYQRFWKTLLEAVSPEQAQQQLTPNDRFPLTYTAVTLQKNDSTGTGKGLLPWLSTATTWPSASGWQPGNWYVFNPDQWKSVRSRQTIGQTQDFIRQQQSRVTHAPATQQIPLHKGWPLLLFFGGSIFLWVEKKLD